MTNSRYQVSALSTRPNTRYGIMDTELVTHIHADGDVIAYNRNAAELIAEALNIADAMNQANS